MGWLHWLFGNRQTSPPSAGETPAPPTEPAAPEPPAEQTAPPREPYLTETVVFGMHIYRRPGDDSSVYFVDEARGIRKMLVDTYGNIQNFPGIVREDFWLKEVEPSALEPQIHFRTSFEKREGGWMMLWEIQPDGRYWADEDGFGWGKDPEVRLYTFVDQNGDFTGPFRIYSCGRETYYQREKTPQDRRT